MATIRSIAVSINAITKPFVDGMKAATTSFGRFRESLNSIGTAKGAFGGLLKDATAFGKIGRLLIGGGALGGVNAVVRSFTDAAARVNDATLALETGKIGVRGFYAEMARGIPLLGNFVKLFDEIFTGGANRKFEIVVRQAANVTKAAELIDEFRAHRQGLSLSVEAKQIREARDAFDAHLRELAKEREKIDADLLKNQLTQRTKFNAEAIDLAKSEAKNAMDLNRVAVGEAQKLLGAMIHQIQTAAEVARSAKIGEALVADAERLRESLLTPLEQFRKEIENVQGLVLAGLLDDEFADRAFRSARKAFERASASGSQSPERVGTVRAIELSRQFVPGINGPGGVANRSFVVKDPQLVETNRRLAEIAKNTGAQGAALVGP